MIKGVDLKSLTIEQQKLAIDLALKGTSLREIMQKVGVSTGVFSRFKRDTHEFRDIFERARLEGLELLADDLLGLADDLSLDVNRSKLKSDNIKWILSKRKAETYGDRIDVNINKTVDISTALLEAKSRVRDVTPQLSESRSQGDSMDSIKETLSVPIANIGIPDIFD